MMKNKKGFTLVELLSVLILFIVIVTIALLNYVSTYDKGKKKVIVDEALVMSEGAINKYSDDRLNKTYNSDIFASRNANKRCYLIKSLLGPYVSKKDNDYHGSVEICTGESCAYRTKIWLTDGEYYINGKIVNDELSVDDVDTHSDSQYFDTCGIDTTNISSQWLFDYTGYTDTFAVPADGTYALEVWGAQGGDSFFYVREMFGANSHPHFYYGGKGGYSYGEMDLKKGDIIYVTVGGMGSYITYDLNNFGPGGYNGGGVSNYHSGGGGGATHIATKLGTIEGLSSDDVIIAAGGGGAAYGDGGMEFTGGSGCNGGGRCDSCSRVCLTGTTNKVVTGLGSGGGFYTSEGAPRTYDVGTACWGGPCWYTSSVSLRAANYGGTGYINNYYINNGVMYVLNGPEYNFEDQTTKNTTNSSEDPIAQYAKEGNGFARITKLD